MKTLFQRLTHYFRSTFYDAAYRDLQRSWLGRAINTISFMMVILMLALWIAVFVILRDSLVASSLQSSIILSLTCFAFFGGLLLAIIIGGWLGNALRRVFWKLLVKLGR